MGDRGASNRPDGEKVWTIGELIDATAGFFSRQQLESSRLEAEILLAHVLVCKRIDLYASFQDAVGDRDRATLRELVKRRAAGEPTAYLVGYREFYGKRFAVDRNVLCPRPETELLIDRSIEFNKSRPIGRLLDVGVGSGCVGLTLLDRWKNANGVGVEISPEAAAVAKTNAESLGVADRFDLRVGDLFDPIKSEERFDLIASNPPYVAESWRGRLDREVGFEPEIALFAGVGGLDVVRRLIAGSRDRLEPGGRLIFEIGFDQEESVAQLIKQADRLRLIEIARDLDKKPRVAVAQAE